MAMTEVEEDRAGDYSALFRTYIERSAEHVLGQIRGYSEGVPPIGDREQTMHTLSYALELPDAWSTTRDLLLEASPKMEQAGIRDEWFSFLEYGLHESLRRDDRATAAELHYELGTLHQRRGEFAEAREHYSTSAEQYESLRDSCRQARALNRIAYVSSLQGQLQQATEHAEQALALLPDDAADEGGYSCMVLGRCAMEKRDWVTAREWKQRSLDLWRQTEDQRKIAWGLHNLSTAVERLGDYDEALACLEQAVTIYDRIDDPVHRAAAFVNMGNVHVARGAYREALSYYERAESVFREVNDTFRLAQVSINVGIAHHYLEEWAPAERAYRKGIRFWQLFDNVQHLINVMDSLGEMYVDTERYDEALEVLYEARRRLDEADEPERLAYLVERVEKHIAQAEGRRRVS